jgi:hypothetical protein
MKSMFAIKFEKFLLYTLSFRKKNMKRIDELLM